MSQVFQTSRIILIIYIKIKIICSSAYLIAHIPFSPLLFSKIHWKYSRNSPGCRLPVLKLGHSGCLSHVVSCSSMMWQLSLIRFTPKLKLALLPKLMLMKMVQIFLNTHLLPDSLPNAVCIFLHQVFTDNPIDRHYYYLHFK